MCQSRAAYDHCLGIIPQGLGTASNVDPTLGPKWDGNDALIAC
jgi:hypothetical protein